MREYGVVFSQFWTDPSLTGVSEGARLLAVYLLTGPHTTLSGCFRLPLGYVAADFAATTETVAGRLEELARIGFVLHCPNTSWLLIPNFLKYNPVQNPNCGKAVAKVLDGIPSEFCYYNELYETLLPFWSRLPKSFTGNFHTRLSKIPQQGQPVSMEEEASSAAAEHTAFTTENGLPECPVLPKSSSKCSEEEAVAHSSGSADSALDTSAGGHATEEAADCYTDASDALKYTSSGRQAEKENIAPKHTAAKEKRKQERQAVHTGAKSDAPEDAADAICVSGTGGSPEALSAEAAKKTADPTQQRSADLKPTADSSACDDPLICTLPLTGDGTFAVHKSFLDEVAPLYPAVDVLQALRSMKGWLVGNPKKRKTRRGITRFIVGWLEREQNRSRHREFSQESGHGQEQEGTLSAFDEALEGYDPSNPYTLQEAATVLSTTAGGSAVAPDVSGRDVAARAGSSSTKQRAAATASGKASPERNIAPEAKAQQAISAPAVPVSSDQSQPVQATSFRRASGVRSSRPGGPFGGYPTKEGYVRAKNRSTFDELREE